jgi:light-regulated signal transduction histidine kinase (bacteriophytochrome)
MYSKKFSSHSSPQKQKGQGFGLAVCKRLMETQKSIITFESQKGKSTTFFIKLPIA